MNKTTLDQCRFILELVVGIEPTTFSLRVRCSAIEPHQHDVLMIEIAIHYTWKQIARQEESE